MTHTAHTSPQRLRRDTSEGKIAGVAAGIGNDVGVDPVVIRLIFVLLVFAGGFGALAYLIAWLVIPPQDESQPISPELQRRLPGSRWNWRAVLGAVALTIGLFAFLGSAGAWWPPDIGAWPIILIVIGAGLLLLRRRDGGEGPPTVPPDDASLPEGSSGAAPPEDAHESTTADLGDDGERAPDTAGESEGSAETTQEFVATPPRAAPPGDAPAPRRGRRRLPIGWATLGVLLVSAALAGLLNALDLADVSAQVFLIVALVVTGVGLLLSAFLGRPARLVFLTVIIAAALGVATLVDNVSIRSGAGDRTVRLASLSELEERYELSAGKLTLDLRDLDLAGQDASLAVGDDRQRPRLPLCRPRARLSSASDQAPADTALPATDQRQSRALHPHNARRLGLRGNLRRLRGAPARSPWLARLLQSAATTRQPRPAASAAKRPSSGYSRS